MSAASRGWGNAASGLCTRHRVEAGPERGDLVALALRREVRGAAARAFSMSAYCCTGGQTMPAAISTGATKSGGRVSTSSGGRSSSSVSTPPSRAQARASEPATTTVPALSGRHERQSVVDHLLLGDADLAEQRARVRRPDAPGDGARRVGERPRALGHGDAVDAARAGRARRRRPRPRTRRRSSDPRRAPPWSAAPSPTRTGRRGSRERMGPATTLDATVPPWRTAKRAGGRRSSRISPRNPSRPTANGATCSGSGPVPP